MDPKYADWIRDYVEVRKGNVRQMCESATAAMVKAFPELERVPGSIRFDDSEGIEHWWCETAEGEVVDPTASQFSERSLSYVRWQPGMEVRVGRCMQCGWDIYDRPEKLDGPIQSICNKECEEAFRRDHEV
jgi:hypothetical protein